MGTFHPRQRWGCGGEPRAQIESQKNAWRATAVGVSLDLRLIICYNVPLRIKGQ